MRLVGWVFMGENDSGPRRIPKHLLCCACSTVNKTTRCRMLFAKNRLLSRLCLSTSLRLSATDCLFLFNSLPPLTQVKFSSNSWSPQVCTCPCLPAHSLTGTGRHECEVLRSSSSSRRRSGASSSHQSRPDHRQNLPPPMAARPPWQRRWP